MKIVFFASDKQRELQLAKAFLRGAKLYGVDVACRRTDNVPKNMDYQYACMVGVKSANLWKLHKDRGVTPIMFDKGYSRERSGIAWKYWRISVGGHNPSHTLGFSYPTDRFMSLGFSMSSNWQKSGGHILLAGSSGKYHNFYDMTDPTTYAKQIIKRIRKFTDRPIIYRPKPSWRYAKPVSGSQFSQDGRPLLADLTGAHAVVTHGSNTCFEASLMGIPSIVLGEGVMKSISSTDLSEIETPRTGERMPLYAALGYHQWTLDEMQTGQAFKEIKEWL